MKKTILASLILASFGASAAEWEVSAGQSYNASGLAWSVGATGLISENWRYHAGFASLGTQNLNTDDTAISADDEIAAGEDPGHRFWVATKPVYEIYATVGYEFHLGEFVVAPEFGLAFYHPMPQADLLPGEVLPPDDNRVNVSYVAGVSIGKGNWAVVITRQNITETVDWVEGYPNSAMVTTAIRYRF